jgi:hypothetical protein
MAINKSILRLKEDPLPGVSHGYSLGASGSVEIMDRIAGPIERVLLWPFYAWRKIDRPIFMVGTYRSGTTILETIVGEHPDVGYFMYVTNLYRRAPLTGYLSMRLMWALGVLDYAWTPPVHNPRVPFTNVSPYEAELVWSQCKRGQWKKECADITLDASYSDPRYERYIRSMIRRHLLVRGASRFMNKNPMNSLRIGFLNRLFADARFVAISRNPVDTVLSQYRTAEVLNQRYRESPLFQEVIQERLRIDMLNLRVKTRTFARTLELDKEHRMLGIANQWKDMQLAVLESMAADPGIGERTLSIQLQDLHTQPVATLERLWDFCELDPEGAAPITAKYADKVGPSPRRTANAEERAILPRVWEIVAPVARQLGYEEPDYDVDYG